MRQNKFDHEVLSDPFIAPIRNWEWNCCIGRQADSFGYADGYIEAAIELAEAVLEKRQHCKRDTLIFPILFSARHAVELRLKLIDKSLIGFGFIAAKDNKKLDHDIRSDYFRLYDANIPDMSFREILSRLRPFVENLSRLDMTGQEFRYDSTVDGKRSLNNHSVINLIIVHSSLQKLAEILKELHYRTGDLCQEKTTGICTNRCSWNDLYEIAQTLPPRAAWSEQTLSEPQCQAMTRFTLSKTQWIKALNKIQNSRIMRRLLGLETPLKYISDENAVLVVAQARHLQNEVNRLSNRGDTKLRTRGEFRFESASPLPKEYYDVESEICSHVADRLAENEWINSEVIFAMARAEFYNKYEVDRYDWHFGLTKEAAMFDTPVKRVTHFLRKGNFCDDFLRGVSILGRPNLAERLRASC